MAWCTVHFAEVQLQQEWARGQPVAGSDDPEGSQGRGRPVAGSDEPEGPVGQMRHQTDTPFWVPWQKKKKITIEDIFLNESVYIFISF